MLGLELSVVQLRDMRAACQSLTALSRLAVVQTAQSGACALLLEDSVNTPAALHLVRIMSSSVSSRNGR